MTRSESALVGPVPAPSVHVMSWNIRRRVVLDPRPSDRWGNRAPRLGALLRAEKPTLLGAQEALPDQANFVRSSLGANYRWVGHGRGRGNRGEGCPIFYDADRLELLDWRQDALSDQPSLPGSTSWGNVIPRVLVFATFRDRTTLRRFIAINTHFDHLSARSRVRSARAVRELVASNSLPAVVTGDLNDHPASGTVRELISDGSLVDVWEMAHTRDSVSWGTLANYREPRRGRRIDWILASPDFLVHRAAINPLRHHGGWGSDHLPVQAVMRLPENGDTA